MVKSYLKDAKAAIQQKDFASALDKCILAFENGGTRDYYTLLFLGLCLDNLDERYQNSDSESFYNRAIAVIPKDPSAFNVRLICSPFNETSEEGNAVFHKRGY